MKVKDFFTDHLNQILKHQQAPSFDFDVPEGAIDLTKGYPNQMLIPSEGIREAVGRVLDSHGYASLLARGRLNKNHLHEKIRMRLIERGMNILKEELLLTSGAPQGIDLICQALVNQDTLIALESPMNLEVRDIFQRYTDQFIEVPVDEEGMKTGELETILKDRKEKRLPLPKIVYTMPAYQYPTGALMPEGRRRHLIELADQFDFLIIEEDQYSELFYESMRSVFPIKTMDTEGRVLHVSTFANILGAGMPIGWVAARREWIEAFSRLTKGTENPFVEAVLSTWLDTVDLKEELIPIRREYFKISRAFMNGLRMSVSFAATNVEKATWYIPQGGFFTWVHVPGIDTEELLDKALDKGVAFVPGKYFYRNPDEGKHLLRVAFSHLSPEEALTGGERLRRVIEAALKRNK